MAKHPAGDVLLVLAFSGGGTRAAALSYGVLQELRHTPVGPATAAMRLLDEVDLITSVSGGSFTSAYYALYGERIFDDYEERFLRRDVQRSLIFALLKPWNWFRLMVPGIDRTDLAIEIYDRQVFDGSTFQSMGETPGPFVQINATDLAVGNRFTFEQDQFDLICSDLSELRVARAVAASSAVPVAFSPIVLENYAGSCGFERPAWMNEALADRKGSQRRRLNAEIAESYLDAEERRFIHLVDGGIADNLGLRAPLDYVIVSGGVTERFAAIGLERPRQLAVVVVNAEVEPPPAFSQSPFPPSLGTIISAVTGIQLGRYNFETLELMRQSLKNWEQELSEAEGMQVRTHLVEVGFRAIEDPGERAFFENLPTTLALDDGAVDQLIEVGRRLLRESPDFQALLAELAPADL
jgi:NTE family protein